MRKRAPLTAAIGLVICGTLLFCGVQLNPSEAQVKDLSGGGDAIAGRTAITHAGLLGGYLRAVRGARPGQRHAGEARGRREARRTTPTASSGAVAPTQWRTPGAAIVEAMPTADGSSSDRESRPISRLQHNTLPAAANETGLRVALGGIAAENQDFVHAVYGNFPYVLLFVVLLTYILLARAFRSLVLPLKAVILNLVSLGAAYGIIVFIFQWGHGAEAIWNVPATNSIIPWIPLMIFAFLYGLSMDYEVFMLTRMREAYDETGDTSKAIALGLARTGKLVTSAALVLCLAFFVLSTQPRHRHQAVRDRTLGRRALRRDRHPRAARAVGDASARPLELVVPEACREDPLRPRADSGSRAGEQLVERVAGDRERRRRRDVA